MIKRNIPNAITCGNLLCGCLAIVKCFEGDLVWAAYLVGIAAVLDFLDGFAARLLNVTSAIGKDLDSLADMVTFGVVPGFIMFKLIDVAAISSGQTDISDFGDIWKNANLATRSCLSYIAFIIPILSAIRLAKFNNDTRQSESFIGLPTPANGIFIACLPLIAAFNKNALVVAVLSSHVGLSILCVFMSLLLLSPIPLFSLKFKHLNWNGNEIRYVFLIWSGVLLATLQFIGVPLIIISYILFSLVNNWFFKPKESR
ncbi:MAG: CDP-alcohol phosphatidyltransferase family protein [Bacteroidetes bacterium]|nr:CDP-alcohol phosphatidyltransferase family protein [Bacteroidota bacterium]